jgi:hypothetical protein
MSIIDVRPTTGPGRPDRDHQMVHGCDRPFDGGKPGWSPLVARSLSAVIGFPEVGKLRWTRVVWGGMQRVGRDVWRHLTSANRGHRQRFTSGPSHDHRIPGCIHPRAMAARLRHESFRSCGGSHVRYAAWPGTSRGRIDPPPARHRRLSAHHGPHSCAVVISSVPGYRSRLTDARAELDRESADDGPRLAYTVNQAARAPGRQRSPRSAPITSITADIPRRHPIRPPAPPTTSMPPGSRRSGAQIRGGPHWPGSARRSPGGPPCSHLSSETSLCVTRSRLAGCRPLPGTCGPPARKRPARR